MSLKPILASVHRYSSVGLYWHTGHAKITEDIRSLLQMTRLLQTPPHFQMRHAEFPTRAYTLGTAKTSTPPLAGCHRIAPQPCIRCAQTIGARPLPQKACLASLSRLTGGFRFFEGFVSRCSPRTFGKGEINFGKPRMMAFQPALGRQLLSFLHHDKRLRQMTLPPETLRQ